MPRALVQLRLDLDQLRAQNQLATEQLDDSRRRLIELTFRHSEGATSVDSILEQVRCSIHAPFVVS